MMACFRSTFEYSGADGEAPRQLRLKFRCDDGMVLYLNGEEWWRYNMPTQDALTSSTPASSLIEGVKETMLLEKTLKLSALLPGTNVLAVSVHQVRPSSSDLAFELALLSDIPLTETLLERTTVEEIAATLQLTDLEIEKMREVLEESQ